MKQMHWFVGYQVLDEDQEILFTGGEFLEVETREQAIDEVYHKFDHHGVIVITEVEHLENPYAQKPGKTKR